jgi:AraC-like DNA-binding protein
MRQRTRPARTPAVRGYAVTHPSGTVVMPTPPGWDQLLYASTGVMTVESSAGTWVVPPHRALWAPEGVAYRVVMHGRVAVRSLYFDTGLGVLDRAWRTVHVPPLLRELVLHAVRECPLDLDRPEHARLVGVILDQLAVLPQAPLQLPMPRDERARALVAVLRQDMTVSLDVASRSAGASRRTLERLFVAETGLPIAKWRQRLRLVAALQLLAAGESVTAVSAAAGYSTPSAFAAMFRAELGTTPGTYFAGPPQPGQVNARTSRRTKVMS